MVKPGGTHGRRRTAEAFPGVQRSVMVVAASGEKYCLIAKALHYLKAKDAAVKFQRTFQIGDLQMDMADAGRRVDHVRRGSALVLRRHNGSPFIEIE
jgi:hypothetical protein